MRNPEEAMKVALAQHTNQVNTCQLTVRKWLDSPSVGDYDGDGRADAEDGWKTEPESARHYDKQGRPGFPASFVGGRRDDGHRALFLRGGKLRSTDFDTETQSYKAGVVGTANNVDVLARAMGVTYVGWSTTIGGKQIPLPPPPPPTRLELFHKGRPRYQLRLLEAASSNASKRRDKDEIAHILAEIRAQVARLPKDRDRSLVNQFVADYKNNNEIRLGLLNVAVGRGRMGLVRQVRDQIRYLIKRLPAR